MIALRIALALVVAVAGYEVGCLFADRLRHRVQELDEWQAFLGLLASDVAYSALALPEALAAAQKSLNGPARELAQRLSSRLEGHVRLAEVWREELERLRPRSCLMPDDLQPLLELGDALGRYGREEHRAHFAHCQERLAVQRRQALEADERGRRLWRTIGAAAGMAVALLLV